VVCGKEFPQEMEIDGCDSSSAEATEEYMDESVKVEL